MVPLPERVPAQRQLPAPAARPGARARVALRARAPAARSAGGAVGREEAVPVDRVAAGELPVAGRVVDGLADGRGDEPVRREAPLVLEQGVVAPAHAAAEGERGEAALPRPCRQAVERQVAGARRPPRVRRTTEVIVQPRRLAHAEHARRELAPPAHLHPDERHVAGQGAPVRLVEEGERRGGPPAHRLLVDVDEAVEVGGRPGGGGPEGPPARPPGESPGGAGGRGGDNTPLEPPPPPARPPRAGEDRPPLPRRVCPTGGGNQ